MFLAKSIIKPRYFAFKSRGFASEVASGRLRLNLVLPHQSLLKGAEVTQVNISTTAGDMGILPDHVPSIEQLKPGVIEVLSPEGSSKKYFASGGFAIIHPESLVDINAVEAFPLDEFSPEALNAELNAANRALNAGATEAEKEEAKIQLEVLEALQAALKG